MPKKVHLPVSETTGSLIRKQREAIHMSVAELSDRIKVSRNTLTNYETGKTEPTASDLIRVAAAVGCEIADLMRAGRPPSPRFAFRAHTALRTDSAVLVDARKSIQAYLEIEAITEAKLCNRLQPFVCDHRSSLSERDIEAIADALRSACGLHDSGPENIACVLEHLGVRCLFFDRDSHGLDGISTIQEALMLVMLKNRTKNIERTIFSAAHELGHLVLHPFLFTTEEVESDDRRNYEKEANTFAGHFLVPSNELVRIWREDRLDRLQLFDALLLLKRVFHVSYHCLYHRVKSLALTRAEYPAFVSQTKERMGIAGKSKLEDLEPEPLESRSFFRTTRFEMLVRSAFLQDLIAVSKVAELLRMTVDKAQEITSAWLRPSYDVVEEGSV